MIFFLLLGVQLVIFGILAVILRSVLTKHITGASGHLQVMTQETAKKLEEAKKRMEEGERHYQESLNKAKEDAEKLKQEAVKQTTAMNEEMVRQARQQSEAITKQAHEAAQAMMKEMDENIQNAALEQSHRIVQQLLEGNLSEESHRHWVEELFKNGFDGLGRMNIATDLKIVEVVSAYPLTPDQKSSVQKRVKEKIKKDVPLHETVDPTLVAGLKMTLGSVVIDGTLKFKIQEMVRHVHHESHK